MPSIYLIPTVLAEGETSCLPSYLLDAVKQCSVFFVENERTARRYLKLLWKEMVIDDYEWFNMKEVDDAVAAAFRKKIKEGKAFGFHTSQCHTLLTGNEVFIADDGFRVPPSAVVSSPRIGVDYAGEHAEWHYRFYIRGSRYVSGKIK